MKHYFKLKTNNYVDYGITKSPKMGECSFMLGRPLDETKLPQLVFEHDFPRSESIPHYLTGGTALVSRQFVDLLNRIGVCNYQSFPALLVNPETGEEREDYFLFNVLGLVAFEDMHSAGNNDFRPGVPEGDDLSRPTFNDFGTSGKESRFSDMFRLAESPPTLIVSDRIVSGLKEYRPVDGWGVVVEQMGTE